MGCIALDDVNGLSKALQRLSHARFEGVVMKSMTQIYNRGKNGGTPVDTGELRISLGQTGDVVGYAKDYAPHVEYGHRTTNGGWVPGQLFLKKNVDEQRPIFERDLKDQLVKIARGR